MAAQSAEEGTLAELEKIASGDQSGTAQPGKSEVVRASGKPDGDWIPKTRLNEVISARNEYAQEATSWKARAAEADKSIANLTAMLANAQKAQETISDLRALANDPVHGAHVRYLHSVLIGEEPQFEVPLQEPTAEATPAEREEYRLAQLQERQDLLAESVEDQRTDAIVQRADTIADSWLEALPDEYTAEDRNAVAHLWTTQVDWQSIDRDPSAMNDLLTESFQNTLNIYGVPRGAHFTSEEVEEVINQQKEETKAPSPEEELGQLFASKNYSGFKSTGKKNFAGTEITTPEVSDDDFARDMAAAMKIANRGRK